MNGEQEQGQLSSRNDGQGLVQPSWTSDELGQEQLSSRSEQQVRPSLTSAWEQL
jgi:hypothetical protein